MTLSDFLARALRTPYALGSFDCCLFPSDWVLAARGFDPAKLFRGRYATQAQLDYLLAAEGGLTVCAASLMAAAGLALTDSPEPGDVGIVKVPCIADGAVVVLEVGAVFSGRLWIVLGEGGLSWLPAEPVLVWRV